MNNSVTVRGIKTHFRTFGTGKGVLIFLHGWGGSVESFERLAPRIAKKNKITAIVPDLPGFGASGNPPLSGWDTHEYEKWLEEFLTALNIKQAHLYGHSFGCRVIVRFLLKHPEYAQKVILTGAAGIKWPPSWRQKVSLWISKHFRTAKKILTGKIQKFILCKVFGARDWGNVSPELKNTLKKVLDEEDVRHLLPSITTPVLLIWGAHDTITPLRSARIFEAQLPHSKLRILPEGKHGIHRTHEEKMVQYVTKFLHEK
ncbi:alpha/beta hydrolase [Candidatus Gracilibacteria bacterium]|nr:alpha/beta hydrolase [Candidatus Gracilibacteria bacterium]